MMLRRHTWPETVRFWRPAPLLATWFGSGLLRPASGTWGTLAGVPFALALVWMGGSLALAIGAALLLVAGTWAADKIGSETGHDDWSAIVVDEVMGLLIALIPAGTDWRLWIVAFIAFRVFDAVKQGPVGWVDSKVKGGFGVMLDDAVAGLMAAAVTLATAVVLV